jgi:hypothetical protein
MNNLVLGRKNCWEKELLRKRIVEKKNCWEKELLRKRIVEKKRKISNLLEDRY